MPITMSIYTIIIIMSTMCMVFLYLIKVNTYFKRKFKLYKLTSVNVYKSVFNVEEIFSSDQHIFYMYQRLPYLVQQFLGHLFSPIPLKEFSLIYYQVI